MLFFSKVMSNRCHIYRSVYHVFCCKKSMSNMDRFGFVGISGEVIQIDAGHCRKLCPRHVSDDPGDASRPAVQVSHRWSKEKIDREWLSIAFLIGCSQFLVNLSKFYTNIANKLMQWKIGYCNQLKKRHILPSNLLRQPIFSFSIRSFFLASIMWKT